MRLLPKNERTRMMGLGVVLLTLAQLFGYASRPLIDPKSKGTSMTIIKKELK